MRRLNHHPSLALWCGNNEIEAVLQLIASSLGGTTPPAVVEAYEELFLDHLLHAVWDQSRSISYSPSSVTNGWLSLNHSAAEPMVERYLNSTCADCIYGDTGE